MRELWLSMMAAALAAVLAACAAKQPAPLPYRFTVAQFEDLRPAEDRDKAETTVGRPFEPRAFVEAVRNQLPYSIFGSVEARLLARLKHYEVTRFGTGFALSMVVEMTATDVYGRRLLTKDMACSQVGAEGFALDDYVTQVRAQKSLEPLTSQGRADTMWQKLYDACVHEMVMAYATALDTASLMPAAGEAR